MFLRITKRR